MTSQNRRPLRRLLMIALLLPVACLANMGDTGSGASTDANLSAGIQAIEAKDWEGAIAALKKAVSANPGSADAHNWLGYAHRKLGRYPESFSAYHEALRLNPMHKAAHEYIGEAYLQTGQPAKAEEHLAELKRLCTPIPCEQYKDLKRAIDAYRKTH